MEIGKRVEIPITVNNDILSEVDIDVLTESMQSLATLFKGDYEKCFPLNVSCIAQALHLINAGLSLRNLAGIVGFDRHIKEYINDKDSAYFVTVLSEYLRSHTDYLEVEPSFDSHPKCPDIKIMFDGKPLYIECKNPKKDILSCLDSEQFPMYDALYATVKKFRCNLTVSYDAPLTKPDLAELALILAERLRFVTGEGTIYNRNGVQVDVTNLGNVSSDVGSTSVPFILENRYSERNLFNFISRNGVAMFFVKKGVSVRDNIASQMKRCSNKVPKEDILVLAIQSDYLTGHIRNNTKVISGLFQSDRFTSLSGVLLSRWGYRAKKGVERQFAYINNPFARHPLKDFERLFRDSGDTALYHL